MQSVARRALRRGFCCALAAFMATGTALPEPAQAQTPTPVRGGTLSLIVQPQPPLLVTPFHRPARAAASGQRIQRAGAGTVCGRQNLPRAAQVWPGSHAAARVGPKLEDFAGWPDL